MSINIESFFDDLADAIDKGDNSRLSGHRKLLERMEADDLGILEWERDELVIELSRRLVSNKNDLIDALTRQLLVCAQRAGEDPAVIFSIIDELAIAFEEVGDFQTAVFLQRLVVDSTKKQMGADSEAYSSRLDTLAELLKRSGNSTEANVIKEQLRAMRDQHEHRGPEPERAGETIPVPDENYQSISVYYVTHRAKTGKTNPYEFYGGERSALARGVARVSVPTRSHEKGIYKPLTKSMRRPGFESDEYFLLKSIKEESREVWLDELRDAVPRDGQAEALIFVHGYNNAFWRAILTAAQLGWDLELRGPTTAYSWPSKGQMLSYRADRRECIDPYVDIHVEGLRALIRDVLDEARPSRLIFVAHSMGCELALGALAGLEATYKSPTHDAHNLDRLKHIILASPDVDLDSYGERLGKLAKLGAQITTYGNKHDGALNLSRRLFNEFERAGAWPERNGYVWAPSVDTSQMPKILGNPLRHWDFASSAIEDLMSQVWFDLPLECRYWLENLNPSKDDMVGPWEYDAAFAVGGQKSTLRLSLIHLRRHSFDASALASLEALRTTLDGSPEFANQLALIDGIRASADRLLRCVNQAR